MKRLTVILSIIAAISFCGCDVKEPQSTPDSSVNNSSESSAGSSTESSTESSEPEVIEQNSKPTFLVGLDGEVITAADIICAGYGMEDLSPSEITPENFGIAEVKGAYVALPSGICRTSLDNSDVFDSENLVFTDVPKEKKRGFIRVTDGDEICGLKVKSAVSTFGTALLGTGLDIPEIYFLSSTLELEGAAELTGYLAIQVEDEYGTALAGDIKFIPSDCPINLPVVYYDFNPTDGFYHPVGNVSSDNGIYYSHEYGYDFFRLGDIDSATADLSGVPRDGSYVKVRVTVENISMNSTIGWFTNVNGEITDITIL